METNSSSALDYLEFIQRLDVQDFDSKQRQMLKARLGLLGRFIQDKDYAGISYAEGEMPIFPDTKEGMKRKRQWQKELDNKRQARSVKQKPWDFQPSSLTIVDLSCPFVDEDMACVLFDMCLGIFVGDRDEGEASRIVALDEAHKVCLLPARLV